MPQAMALHFPQLPLHFAYLFGHGAVSPWIRAVFGTGKGAGAAAFFLVLFGLGLATCLAFRKDRALWRLEIGRDAAGGGMN